MSVNIKLIILASDCKGVRAQGSPCHHEMILCNETAFHCLALLLALLSVQAGDDCLLSPLILPTIRLTWMVELVYVVKIFLLLEAKEKNLKLLICN